MKSKTKFRIVLGIILLITAFMIVTSIGGSDHIDIVGSTSVQPVAEKLVETYKVSHPDAHINVQGGGSSVGIKSVHDGTADVGTTSRSLKNDEGDGVNQDELGLDGIVIAVNNENNVSDLSKEQLAGIFSGNITNWNEVGGSDQEIHVITRESGSGTLDSFQKLVLNGDKVKEDAIVQSSTEAVKQSVQQDPGAIGFVSYAHMSDDVKTVSVDNVSPTDSTIADGSYELARPFIFLYEGTPSGELKSFLDWVNGSEGQKILNDEKIIKSNK